MNLQNNYYYELKIVVNYNDKGTMYILMYVRLHEAGDIERKVINNVVGLFLI